MKPKIKGSMTSIVAAVVMLFWGGSAPAVTLSVTPVSQSIGVGSTVDVSVSISGLGDFMPDSLSTFDLDMSYDSSVLAYQNVAFGDPALGNQLDLFGLGSIQDVITATNSVEVLEFSLDDPLDLDSLQEGGFQLFTLTFMALATGTSPIGISVFDIGDAVGDPLAVSAINPGSVTIVPIPAAAWLFVSGFLGLLGIARRKAA